MNEPPPHPSETADRPSRGERKREARAILALARELVALPPGRRAALTLTPELDAAVERVRGMPSHGAHKRELGWLAGRLRAADRSETERLRAELDRAPGTAGVAHARRAEALAQRLLDDPSALEELLDARPDIDRQHLRSLLRNARSERQRQAAADTPPSPARARRALFHFLRALPEP